MNSKSAKTNNCQEVYSGDIFRIVKESYKSLKGDIEEFEYAEVSDAVRVYPVSKGFELTLISEMRYGIEKSASKRILRTVSGRIEKNESAEQAALRESLEEIGLISGTPFIFHVSRPMLKVRHHLFHVLILSAEYGATRKLDKFEDIDPIRVNISEVEKSIWSGEFEEDIVAFGLLKLLRYLKENTPNEI